MPGKTEKREDHQDEGAPPMLVAWREWDGNRGGKKGRNASGQAQQRVTKGGRRRCASREAGGVTAMAHVGATVAGGRGCRTVVATRAEIDGV